MSFTGYASIIIIIFKYGKKRSKLKIKKSNMVFFVTRMIQGMAVMIIIVKIKVMMITVLTFFIIIIIMVTMVLAEGMLKIDPNDAKNVCG